MDLPKRKRLRLEGYDYSQAGAYFVTICTKDKACILGQAADQGPCRLTPTGETVQREILALSARFPSVTVDKYVVMPNHAHIILLVEELPQEPTGQPVRRARACPCRVPGTDAGETAARASPCPTLGDIIGVMKSFSTRKANAAERLPGRKIWQARFHDHIIRNDAEYKEIWQYIDENPLKWKDDCFYEP